MIHYLTMSYKYPDSTNDPNIYADDRTNSYYSSKSTNLADKYSKVDDLYSKLFDNIIPGVTVFLVSAAAVEETWPFLINPVTNRDAGGRLFYVRPEEKYRFLIERLGFVLIESELQDDSLGREVQWCVQVLGKKSYSPL